MAEQYIKRTYRVTRDQDKIVKKIARKSKSSTSESAVIRGLINLAATTAIDYARN